MRAEPAAITGPDRGRWAIIDDDGRMMAITRADEGGDLAARVVTALEDRKQVLAALDACPDAVRVREGGGPENVGASVAVTLARVAEELFHLRAFVKQHGALVASRGTRADGPKTP